jgi:hypothetical protein
VAVARHPSLWPTAVRLIVDLAPRGWWRRRPHLPVPDPDYLAFRFETMYGSGRAPEAEDVLTYLRWCREYRHLA